MRVPSLLLVEQYLELAIDPPHEGVDVQGIVVELNNAMACCMVNDRNMRREAADWAPVWSA